MNRITLLALLMGIMTISVGCKSQQPTLSPQSYVLSDHNIHPQSMYSLTTYMNGPTVIHVLRDNNGNLLAESHHTNQGIFIRLPSDMDTFLRIPSEMSRSLEDEFRDVWSGAQEQLSIIFLRR